MPARAWDSVEPDAQNAFGFIAIDEHTHKGCVIQEATDLGARLVMIDAGAVPGDFVLYSYSFDTALPCRAIARTDEMIDVWFNCDDFGGAKTPSLRGGHVG